MIIDRLNYMYFILIGIVILSIILVWIIFRKKTEKAKKIFVISICLFDIIFFFIYKYWLSIDPVFLKLNNLERFNWWNELPLQLCNINMFLIPISLLTNNKFLKSYAFFITPLGALCALTFPENAFVGDSIFVLRNIGFYGTHMILIIAGVSLLTLGLYEPKVKEIFLPAITTFGLATIMFVFNTILRNTVCAEANYFFTHDASVPVLSTFYKWIPIPLIYELLSAFILIPYCLIITYIYKIIMKYKKDVLK